jgi:hypothetical protein
MPQDLARLLRLGDYGKNAHRLHVNGSTSYTWAIILAHVLPLRGNLK